MSNRKSRKRKRSNARADIRRRRGSGRRARAPVAVGGLTWTRSSAASFRAITLRDAGLQCHFGMQLEKAHDGMSLGGGMMSDPRPPRVASRLGRCIGWPWGLSSKRCGACTAQRCLETAERVKAKFNRPPTTEEIDSAIAKADHYFAILQAYLHAARSGRAVGVFLGSGTLPWWRR